jgi:hypothetical protein
MCHCHLRCDRRLQFHVLCGLPEFAGRIFVRHFMQIAPQMDKHGNRYAHHQQCTHT